MACLLELGVYDFPGMSGALLVRESGQDIEKSWEIWFPVFEAPLGEMLKYQIRVLPY